MAMKKAQFFSPIVWIIIGLVVIVVIIFAFAGKPFLLSLMGGKIASGSETNCKEANYKFPVYDKDGQYILCISCLDECLSYEEEDACNSPKFEKCGHECRWEKKGLFGGECLLIKEEQGLPTA